MSYIITQPCLPLTWQQELAQAFTHPSDLLEHLGLIQNDRDHTPILAFSFRVPRPFAARMRRGDPKDPLLLQVLPQARENISAPGFVSDPVGDRQARVAPGLLHKYHGRVLMIVTGACAVHCRYCFRREFPYHHDQLTPLRQQESLDYIRNDPSIEEVILSGGDPLVLSNERLHSLIHAIEDIPHLSRLRIHSRLPVVLPSRVDSSLVDMLTACRLEKVMVVHINHANEIDERVCAAVNRLRLRGVTVLNQSTLLAGINDNEAALVELQRKSFTAGILPYYLHLLDRTCGTSHFEVSESTARFLHERLRRQLPGYLVPRLARDKAHAPYKILL